MTEMNEDLKPIIDPAEEASDDEFREAMKAAEAAAHIEPVSVGASESTYVAIDSLQGNEFAVELDGNAVKGIFRVSGLTTILADADAPANVVIAKMVQRDATMPFNQWLRQTVEAESAEARPVRRLDIIAIDDGEETRRWTLEGATIVGVSYTDFDTASSDLVEELVTIRYSAITEQWTWSDK